ncbi:hypothetical protein I6I99_11025 [Sphingobacterium multivorum]|nr:hypothetical protein [Sphingobacterium multivorum]QQT33059.1 hypothetical protein I6I99_11025 [Sphingobacterium multivorum]
MKRTKILHLSLSIPVILAAISSCKKDDPSPNSNEINIKNRAKVENFQVTYNLKDSATIKQIFNQDPLGFYKKAKGLPYIISNNINASHPALKANSTNNSSSGNSWGVDPYEQSDDDNSGLSYGWWESDLINENDDNFAYGLMSPSSVYNSQDISVYMNGDYYTDFTGNYFYDSFGNPMYKSTNWLWGNRFADPYNTFALYTDYSAPVFRTNFMKSSVILPKRNINMFIFLPYRYAVQRHGASYEFKFTYAGCPEFLQDHPESLYYITSNNGMGDIDYSQVSGIVEILNNGQFNFELLGLKEKRIKVYASNGRVMMSTEASLSTFKVGTEIEAGITITNTEYAHNLYQANGSGQLQEFNYYDRPTYQIFWTGYSYGPQY